MLTLLAQLWANVVSLSRPISQCAGIVTTIGAPVQITWLNRNLDSASRATVISMTGQANSIGRAVGGPALGWGSNTISIKAAILASAAILAPTIALYHHLIARERGTTETLFSLPELIRTE